ncbi:MAG: sensor histidine kinase, partial [Calditrichaeota bacterium]
DNGRGRVEIRSYYEKKSKEVVVKVKDNGPGLQEEFLDKIFQPFFTMKLGGTGLGLSICERIIHQHHGKIEAKNGENQGMLFTIKFPIVNHEG